MIEVEGQDGSVFEFPDGTPRNIIKNAIMKHYGGPSVGAAASMPIQSEVPVTIEPNPNAKTIQGKTFGQKAMDVVQDAATRMQGINRGTLEIGLAGASPQALGLADAAIGRGTISEQQAKRRAELESTDPVDRGIGNALGILMTAPAGGATTLGQGVRQGAGLGGVLGYNMSDGDLMSTAIGAGAGAAGPVAARMIARAINPVSNYAVQTLRKMGVSPTVGQLIGPKASAVEQRMMASPFLGDVVAGGRRRAAQDWNRGTVNEALRPAGLSVPASAGNGRQIIRAADDMLSAEYDRILNPARVNVDDQFLADLTAVSNRASGSLKKSGVKEMQRQANEISSLAELNDGVVTGKTVQQLRSKIRSDARKFSRSEDPFKQRIGEALNELDDTFTGLLERNLTPADGAQLRALDNSYRRFMRVQEASTVAPTKGGEFTPGQLLATTKKQAEGVRNKQFSRAEGVGQEQAQAAQDILGNTIPDSGTAGNLSQTAIGAGGMYGAMNYPIATSLAAGSLVAPMPAYTKIGQKLLADLIAGRQGPGYASAANAVRGAGPAAGMGAAASIPYLQGLFQNNPR